MEMNATVLAGAPAVISSDRNLTAEELAQARLFLAQTKSALLGATRGLSDAQWRFKPAPERWSIVEILDHVVIVQERVLGPILDQLVHAPAPPADQDYKLVDAIVIHEFPTRLAKFSAPEFIHPVEHVGPSDLLDRLNANYARLAERLDSAGLRQHVLEAPPLKAVTKGVFTVMDGYQWILAAAAHTERHAKQMLEVMADPHYPA
jgi:DinB superfamily